MVARRRFSSESCQDQSVPTLPALDRSLLVRTDFSDDEGWELVADEAQRENADGFCAFVEPVSDPAFEGADWQTVRAAVPSSEAAVVFVVDAQTLRSSDHAILVVDRLRGRPPFRCIPPELWSIDNNLNIANMDWEEFAGALDESGVFRGFD